MAFVYILKSLKDGGYYIGSSVDVKKRFDLHRKGKVFSTRFRLPVKLMLVQEYKTYKIARRIEKRVKLLKRKDYLEKMINDGKIKMVA